MILHARNLAALFAAMWLCGGALASMATGAAPQPHETVVSAAAPVPLLQPTLCGPALSAGAQGWLTRAPRAFDAAILDQLSRAASSSDAAPADGSGVVTLPPGPGSASLVACGLAVLGAVGGVRSLRKANFGPLPDWYSTSGPTQIGHATPLDPDFPVFAVRAFETVDPAVSIHPVDPVHVDISPQLGCLGHLSPRGPPSR